MAQTSSDKLVFPGDLITEIQAKRGITILGPGLKRTTNPPNSVQATRAGILKFKSPNTYWLDPPSERTKITQKRYIPKRGDTVVGIVVKKSVDILRLDIGSGEYANLSFLAFEGAAKKSKPDVQVGDTIYARVLSAHREMEPELVCVDSYFKAGRLGVLSNDGFVFNISGRLTIRLLDVENPILQTIAKVFPYEITIGMNGRIWLQGRSVKETITIMTIIKAAEKLDDAAFLRLQLRK